MNSWGQSKKLQKQTRLFFNITYTMQIAEQSPLI